MTDQPGSDDQDDALPVVAEGELPDVDDEERLPETPGPDGLKERVRHYVALLRERAPEYASEARALAERGIEQARDRVEATASKVDYDLPNSPSSVPSSALVAVVLGVLIIGSGMLFIPSATVQETPGSNASSGPAPTETPRSGTISTPEPEPDPAVQRLSAPAFSAADLASLPASHVGVGGPGNNTTDVPEPETIRASEGSQTMTVEAVERNGTTALVLSDNDVHGGRWVSVSTGWLRNQTGEVPSTVAIEHSSGDEYYSSVQTRSDEAAFYVRNFSSNTVTFEESIQVTGRFGPGSTVSYVVEEPPGASDPNVTLSGVTTTLWDNTTQAGVADGGTVSLAIDGNVAPYGLNGSSRPTVRLSGRETTFAESRAGQGYSDGQSRTISVGGDAPPVNLSVMFTGSTSISDVVSSVTGLADGDTFSFDISGNQPTDVSVTFIGRETTASGSASGTGGGSVSVGGNLAPTGESVTFEGRETTFSESGSGTGSGSVSVGGNLPPTGESVTFAGRESTSSASGSGTGSGSVSVGGNLSPTSQSVTFEGRETTTSTSASRTGVSPTSSTSISVGGNLNPSGPASGSPEISVTAHRDSANPVGSSSEVESAITCLYNAPYNTEIRIDNPPSEIHTLAYDADTIYGDIDQTTWNIRIVSGEDPDNTYGEGTRVMSSWSPSGTTGSHTIDISDYSTNANTITVEFIHQSGCSSVNGDSTSDAILMDSISRSGNWNAHSGDDIDSAALDLSAVSGTPSSVSVSVGTGSASFGSLSDGQSASSAISFSPSASSVSWSADANGAIIDWSLSWTERTGTEDPRIDTNGDGSTDASFNGVLSAGETTTVSASGLSLGSNSIDAWTATAGPAPSWTLSWTERTGTEDPRIDTNGDGTADAVYNGVLASGETATVSTDGLSSGSNSIDTWTATAGPAPTWDLSWTARRGTEDPRLDTDGDGTAEASYNGILSSGETTTVSADGLSPGSNTIDAWALTAGPDPSWSLSWTEVTATENPSVDIDQDGTTDASYSGILQSGDTQTVSAGQFASGSHSGSAALAAGQMDLEIGYNATTATENPSLDLDGDGSADASYSGVLSAGESATVSAQADLSTGSNTITVSTSGAAVDWNLSYERVEHSSGISIDAGNDGTVEATVAGPIAPGETVTRNVSGIDLSTSTLGIGTGSGTIVDVGVLTQERQTTTSGSVVLNGNPTSFAAIGTGTTTLTLNSSSLVNGTNTVEISLVDPSGPGPQPRVDMEYRHDVTRTQTILYESEGLSERYNVTRTFPTRVTSGTLTIPHASTVYSMRSLQYTVNSTTWSQIPASAYEFNQTHLVIDTVALATGPNETSVPPGTTVEVATVGSRVRTVNSSITVLEPTTVGSDLNSRIRIDQWTVNQSALGLGETAQGRLVHYGTNATYAAADEYVVLTDTGTQRMHFPNYPGGNPELTLRTLPVDATPQTGSVRASVPESISNASRPALTLKPAGSTGDPVSLEYIAGDDAVWYGAIDQSTGGVLDRDEGGSLEISDASRTIVIEQVDNPNTGTEANQGAGGIVNAVAGPGNFLPLAVIFGFVAVVIAAGRAPERTRSTAENLSESAERLAERLPAGSSAVASAAETLFTTAADGLVRIGKNQILTTTVAALSVIASVQAGLIKTTPETEAIGAVAGIGIISLVILREMESFTLARWIAIVGVSGVVGIQALGQTSLIRAIVDSQAFILVVLIAGYAVVQLVREYRANNNPNDDRPQIVIDSDGGGD